jgi:RNA-binding protein YhbY
MTSTEMQLGKNGITSNFIQTLKSCFEKHDSVRISILPSAGHERTKISEYTQEVLKQLGQNYSAKNIGFKIVVRKWRKSKSKKLSQED